MEKIVINRYDLVVGNAVEKGVKVSGKRKFFTNGLKKDGFTQSFTLVFRIDLHVVLHKVSTF